MDCYSIYIPRISSFYNERAVIEVMERYHIGLVNRVDFTNCTEHPGPGFSENLEDPFMSAYVHFEFPYILKDKRYAFYSLENCNNEFWDMIENNLSYRLQVNRHEYWVCMKNNYPVSRTRMNIHQVVDTCRQLESVVMAQRDYIFRLEQLLITHDRTLQVIVANMLKTQLEQQKPQKQAADKSRTDSLSYSSSEESYDHGRNDNGRNDNGSDEDAEEEWVHSRKLERKCCLNMHKNIKQGRLIKQHRSQPNNRTNNPSNFKTNYPQNILPYAAPITDCGAKTVSLFSQPYLDTVQQRYLNIVVVNLQPQGPLGDIVRLVKFPPLSEFKRWDPDIKQCGLALQSLSCDGSLMVVDEVPTLISFLVSNGYTVDTSVTKMFNTSDIRFNTNTGNKLICFITYQGL